MNHLKIHFVGVGGTGTGSLAVALAQAGHSVSGSDGKLYEPMKGVLQRANIHLFEGYEAGRLNQIQPDLVIVGNVVRKDNPEAMAWISSGARFCSFPEAVRTLVIRDQRSVVCAGTHGKTSTTTWLSFLLSKLGKQPSYLIGGVPRDLPTGCLINQGEWFIGEGDEYDSAFFDKGPKFLHYHPHFAIIACIEFDHADIYRDLDHVKASFEKLIAILPGDGLCIARFDDPNVMQLTPGSLCPVQTFGVGSGAMWRLIGAEEDAEGATFEVAYKGRSAGKFRTQTVGEHNYLNLISGLVAGVNMGLPMEQMREVVPLFQGARRRQEILMRSPVLLIDDFAHHPTEVAVTLSAIRKRFPQGKLWALFEPRSATARRNVHQEAYGKAFAAADRVLLSVPFNQKALSSDQALSTENLSETLRASGKSAQSYGTVEEIVECVKSEVTPGDIVVVMSNGEFGKIQEKIQNALS